jgi:hypothetical protein
MESQHKDFQKVFNQFTPEGDEDIEKLNLVSRNRVPRAEECILPELEERLVVEKTTHEYNIVTFANWFSRYSSRVSSARAVVININGVDADESIVVTIPNDQGKRLKDFDKRHLRLIENANIIPVINAEPIDMFVYNNGYQVLYSIGGDTYLKGYSVRKKFIVNICKDVMDYMIPIGSFIVKRGDRTCKFKSYDLGEIIEQRIRDNLLDMEKLAMLYHQSNKFEFSNFNGLLKCLSTRQGGIKDVQHQLEIDNAIQKLCLDGVEYEA